MEKKNELATPEQIEIPPLPGGGSWSWSGSAWVPKDDPAPEATAPTPNTTEE